jgi:hypothetical protein
MTTATAKKPLPSTLAAHSAPASDAPARPSLFSLREDELALYQLLLDCGGDVTEESTAAAVEAWMQELESATHEKVDGYCRVIRRLTLDAAVANEEKERYRLLAEKRTKAAQRLKDRLKDHMTVVGKLKIETQHNRLAVTNNGGVQPLDIPNVGALPDGYVDLIPQANTEKIRKAIAAGETVEGVTVLPRGTHLRMA